MIPPIPGMPYGFPATFPLPTHAPRQPLGNNTVTERDVQLMLRKHKKRRALNEVNRYLSLV